MLQIKTSLLTLLFVALAATNRADTPPNIVFIMADDLGYGDVHALNAESAIPTPHLDSLATSGMTFTDAHTPSAVCTPTRYALLTGRYCWRSSLKRGVLNGYGKPLIEQERPTVATFLSGQGYHTGIVGKWHLGLEFATQKARQGSKAELDFSKPVEQGPNARGFDYSYIIPASLDFPPYVFIENGNVTEPETVLQPAQKFPAFLRRGPRSTALQMEDCLDNLVSKASDFVREQSKTDKPFFLYFPLSAPHKPVLPHSRFRGKTDLGPYGDFVAQVDWTVGQLLAALKESGVENETLLIFTSDNGSFMHRLDQPDAKDHVDDETIQAFRSDRHRPNFLFRGTKADIWEAGHRVPFFVRWPDHVAAGSTNDRTICLVDLFATTADLLDQEIPTGAAPDSFSLLPLFDGRYDDWSRAPVIHHSVAGMFAIRDGKWKLVLGNGSGGRERPAGKPFQKPYALFDMSQDVVERHNVIGTYPEVAARMEQECLRIRDSGSSR